MSINLEPFIHEIISRKLNVLGVVVRQHGVLCSSFFWSDSDVLRYNINSCTKSITSMAMGIAAEEGILSLEEKPAEIFPDCLPEAPQQWLLDMTILDMLKMTTGHNKSLLPRIGRDENPETNWVKLCFSEPLAYPPGTCFQYNNMGTYLCSVILQDRTGMTMRDWLKPRLFDPLRIQNPQWFTCPRGYTQGMGGLFLTTEELSRIGQLCLNGGRWNGAQLVPAEYLNMATTCQSKGVWTATPTADFSSGYGYGFWMNANVPGYRGFGNDGEHFIVLPQYDAVIAITSHDKDHQGVLDAVWAGLLPEFEKQ